MRCISMALLLAAASVSAADDPVTLQNVKPVGPHKKSEATASFSMERATRYLDSASLSWQKDHNCFACHTNFAYLYARPLIDAKSPAHQTVRKALEDLVEIRWEKSKPRWDAEVVASAAALAFNDAATTGKLHATTKKALDRMWTVQKKDGGWSWLKCSWPPMENDDHYGATLAAVALGVAPDDYRKTELAQAGLTKMRGYFEKNPPENLHHKAMLLWGNSYLGDLLTAEKKQSYVEELLKTQLADGGWAGGGFGDWRRGDKTTQDKTASDGYGTGFAVYILRRSGLPKDHPAIDKGIAWLHANQRESGRWWSRSLFRDNQHLLTNAGTAFAVMALAETK
jgi:squalene-hopene/tetraprenyl-beta-curcumene cyclase